MQVVNKKVCRKRQTFFDLNSGGMGQLACAVTGKTAYLPLLFSIFPECHTVIGETGDCRHVGFLSAAEAVVKYPCCILMKVAVSSFPISRSRLAGMHADDSSGPAKCFARTCVQAGGAFNAVAMRQHSGIPVLGNG